MKTLPLHSHFHRQEWLKRLALLPVVYVALYFLFGYFIAWQSPTFACCTPAAQTSCLSLQHIAESLPKFIRIGFVPVCSRIDMDRAGASGHLSDEGEDLGKIDRYRTVIRVTANHAVAFPQPLHACPGATGTLHRNIHVYVPIWMADRAGVCFTKIIKRNIGTER